MASQDIEITQHDDEVLELAVTRQKVPFDITGCKIWITAKLSMSDADVDAVFQKDTVGGGIEVTNYVGGLADISIYPSDTNSLTLPTWLAEKDKFDYRFTLYYDVQIKTTSGKIFTLAEGMLLVRPDITQTTA